MKITLTQISVGVDIAKRHLDVCLHGAKKFFRVPNNKEGIAALLRKLAPYDIKHIAFESSGGYEYKLKQTVREAGYKVWQINPLRIKAFITSKGMKAKTDKIDAKMIAWFAAENECDIPQATAATEQLSVLVQRRDSLVQTISGEKKRLQQPHQELCTNQIEEHIAFLEKQVEELDEQAKTMIKADAAWNQKAEQLTSIDGVGDITAAVIIAQMPELGTIDDKKAGSLVGLVPYTNESGTYKGVARINGGRFLPRKILYMATLSAIQCNKKIRRFYQRLIAAGKKPKVALIAAMHKLVIIMNAMLKKGTMWNPNL